MSRRVFEFAVADATEGQSAQLFPLLTSACGQYHSYVAGGKLPRPQDAGACLLAHDCARKGRVPFTTCLAARGLLAVIVKTDRTSGGVLHTSMCLVVLDPATGKFRRDGSVRRALMAPKHQGACWNGDCGATSSRMTSCQACGVARYCGDACAAAHRKYHESMCCLLT